jgi:hypothetical protein
MAQREDGPEAARPVEAVPPPTPEDPTWRRLEEAIDWYDHRAAENQRLYKWLKLLEIAVAAALPVVAGVGAAVWVIGSLAALVVVLEGAQHLFQFQEHWITYRATAESLKHEHYLYLARAGPYGGEDRRSKLATRTEVLISQEHAKWVTGQQRVTARSEEQ